MVHSPQGCYSALETTVFVMFKKAVRSPDLTASSKVELEGSSVASKKTQSFCLTFDSKTNIIFVNEWKKPPLL
jgi:hypothetical protein